MHSARSVDNLSRRAIKYSVEASTNIQALGTSFLLRSLPKEDPGRGEKRVLKFAIQRIWQEPTDHSNDCYFCVVDPNYRTGKNAFAITIVQ
ncbi:hypothetical protein J437_LFUL006732 [Ladona fulva]|uniref:Uncharacterized protein n=1 Tax=Ladona fulva TaxID=123851 RepID=A0A8K0K161_LADFU|nr:hypothetical protein J437_LFUL006732 [Ladona fulva]